MFSRSVKDAIHIRNGFIVLLPTSFKIIQFLPPHFVILCQMGFKVVLGNPLYN